MWRNAHWIKAEGDREWVCVRWKDGRQMAVYTLRWLDIPFEGRYGVRFALRGFSTLEVSGVTKTCRRSIRWCEDFVTRFPLALCRHLAANLLSVDVWHLMGRHVWLTLSAEEGSRHLYFRTSHAQACLLRIFKRICKNNNGKKTEIYQKIKMSNKNLSMQSNCSFSFERNSLPK